MPEWGCLLVYTPARPKVHYLDARSWLVFDLCDGTTTYSEVLDEFGEAVPEGTTAAQIKGAVDIALNALVTNGLVDHQAAASHGGPETSADRSEVRTARPTT